MSARRILVIGGGPAGTFAAIGAKKQDPAASVVLLTREHCEPYEKPPLSKAVLVGSVAPDAAPIAGPGGVGSHNVVLELRADCAAIDRAGRTIVLTDGRRLPYDALVLATGAVPRELPLLPIGMPRVHYLRTEAEGRVTGRAKFVRAEFVEKVKQSEHWQHQAVVPNLLAEGAEGWIRACIYRTIEEVKVAGNGIGEHDVDLPPERSGQLANWRIEDGRNA